MSSPSAVTSIGNLTVEELRKELSKHGLDKKGRKSVLLARLIDFLEPEVSDEGEDNKEEASTEKLHDGDRSDGDIRLEDQKESTGNIDQNLAENEGEVMMDEKLLDLADNDLPTYNLDTEIADMGDGNENQFDVIEGEKNEAADEVVAEEITAEFEGINELADSGSDMNGTDEFLTLNILNELVESGSEACEADVGIEEDEAGIDDDMNNSNEQHELNMMIEAGDNSLEDQNHVDLTGVNECDDHGDDGEQANDDSESNIPQDVELSDISGVVDVNFTEELDGIEEDAAKVVGQTTAEDETEVEMMEKEELDQGGDNEVKNDSAIKDREKEDEGHVVILVESEREDEDGGEDWEIDEADCKSEVAHDDHDDSDMSNRNKISATAKANQPADNTTSKTAEPAKKPEKSGEHGEGVEMDESEEMIALEAEDLLVVSEDEGGDFSGNSPTKTSGAEVPKIDSGDDDNDEENKEHEQMTDIKDDDDRKKTHAKNYNLSKERLDRINCKYLSKEIKTSTILHLLTLDGVHLSDMAAGPLQEILNRQCTSYTWHCKPEPSDAESLPQGYLEMVFKSKVVMELTVKALNEWNAELKPITSDCQMTPSSKLKALGHADKAIGPVENIVCIYGSTGQTMEQLTKRFPDREIVNGQNIKNGRKTGNHFMTFDSASEAAEAVEKCQDLGEFRKDWEMHPVWVFLLSSLPVQHFSNVPPVKGQPLAPNQLYNICMDVCQRRLEFERKFRRCDRSELPDLEADITAIEQSEKILCEDDELRKSLHLPGDDLCHRWLQVAFSKANPSAPNRYQNCSVKTDGLREKFNNYIKLLEKEEDDRKKRIERRIEEREKQRALEKERRDKKREEREKQQSQERMSHGEEFGSSDGSVSSARQRSRSRDLRSNRSSPGRKSLTGKRAGTDRSDEQTKRSRTSLEEMPESSMDVANAISTMLGATQSFHGNKTAIRNSHDNLSKDRKRPSSPELEDKEKMEWRDLEYKRKLHVQKKRRELKEKLMKERNEMQDKYDQRASKRTANDASFRPSCSRNVDLEAIERKAAFQREVELQRRAELERQVQKKRDNVLKDRYESSRYSSSQSHRSEREYSHRRETDRYSDKAYKQRDDSHRYTQRRDTESHSTRRQSTDRYPTTHSQRHETDYYSSAATNKSYQNPQYYSSSSNTTQYTSTQPSYSGYTQQQQTSSYYGGPSQYPPY